MIPISLDSRIYSRKALWLPIAISCDNLGERDRSRIESFSEVGLMDGFELFPIKYLMCILHVMMSFPYDLTCQYLILMRNVDYASKIMIPS